LVLGDLQGHKRLEKILDETVKAGLLSREVADVWMVMTIQMYGNLLRPAMKQFDLLRWLR
jgi:hypothetical protein